MKETDPDPLAELREQIRATTAAAGKLAAETAAARDAEATAADEPGARGAGPGRMPPAGWATSGDQAVRQQELQALVALVEALRDLVPAELKEQVRDVLRQLLLLVRTLIDWWVERMDGSRPPATTAGPPVEEIPID